MCIILVPPFIGFKIVYKEAVNICHTHYNGHGRKLKTIEMRRKYMVQVQMFGDIDDYRLLLVFQVTNAITISRIVDSCKI